MEVTLHQRLMMALKGYAFSHKEVLKEGTEPVSFYIARCKLHGYYLDCPHGFKKELRCPMCKEAEG